jgi:hypothetical protein
MARRTPPCAGPLPIESYRLSGANRHAAVISFDENDLQDSPRLTDRTDPRRIVINRAVGSSPC